jgi:hypothetical protein
MFDRGIGQAPSDGQGGFTSASCPSMSFCAVVLSDGGLAGSTTPATANGPEIDFPTAITVNAVSCSSPSLCVAVGSEHHKGLVIRSDNPGAAHPLWVRTAQPGTTNLDAVDCPSSSLCAATDTTGSVLVSTNPTPPQPRWQRTDVDGKRSITAISCPSNRLCIAVDTRGRMIAGVSH